MPSKIKLLKIKFLWKYVNCQPYIYLTILTITIDQNPYLKKDLEIFLILKTKIFANTTKNMISKLIIVLNSEVYTFSFLAAFYIRSNR